MMEEAENQILSSDPAVIEEQAAEWLVRRYDSMNWDARSEQAFGMWVAASPANQLAYWRLEAAWTRADRLNALHKKSSTYGIKKAELTFRIFTRAAMALVLIGGVLAGTKLFLTRDWAVTYQTGIGGHRVLALSDGSRIELNTQTTIRVNDSANGKQIWLDHGEAYFRVKHDPARRFVVIAGRSRIVDLGTQFVIRRDAGDLEVSLIEGRAQIEPVDKAVSVAPFSLKPGDVAVAKGGKITLLRKPLNAIADSLGWRRGLLIFADTPLAKVADEFNRYNERKLVVVGKDVRNLGVGGHFEANNAETFARVARGVLGLHVASQGNEIVISR